MPTTSTGDPIKDQFASIHDMFGSTMGPSGGRSSSSSPSSSSSNIFTPEPINTKPTGGNPFLQGITMGIFGRPSKDDSLTVQLKELLNLLGVSGQDTLTKGGNVFDAGTGVLGAGIQDLQDPLAYWSKILSGDPQAMTEATAPEAAALGDQYAAAQRAAETGGPAGGYRSATLANLPFQKARDIGDLQQKLRPQAASNVTNIAQILSQLGITEQGVGLGEQSLGVSELQAALQGYLARRGQNIQSTGQNLNFISNLIGTLLGSKGVAGVTGGGALPAPGGG